MTGRLVAPDLATMKDRWLQPGQPIAQVIDDTGLIVYATVNQMDHQRITESVEGYQTAIRFVADQFREIEVPLEQTKVIDRATNEARSPALTQAAGGTNAPDPSDPSGRKLAESVFEFQASLPNDANYVVGQRAWVRVTVNDREPLILQGYRYLLQLIQTTRAR
jgi:hypothetical protein